jgi:Outer membrane protein beta-barrel domain
MHVSRRWLSLCVLGATLGTDLQAQSAQPFSLQVSGLFNGVVNDVFIGLKNGVGAEAQVRYTPGALSVGAGFQFTIHQLEQRSDNARFYGGFVEPRYRIHAGSNVVAPYVSARFAVLKVGFSGEDLKLTSTFLELNGGGGILVRLGPRVNLDAGATIGYNHLGDGTLTSRSGPVPESVGVEGRSGSNLVAHLGLAIGLRD